jgi:hypothetical protein
MGQVEPIPAATGLDDSAKQQGKLSVKVVLKVTDNAAKTERQQNLQM